MSLLFSQGTHFSSRKDIQAFQEKKLNEHIHYLSTQSPFYRRVFESNGIPAGAIFRLEDLSKLPFTTKEDIQKDNLAFLCVPAEKIIEYVATTGTTGQPVTIALTENDLKRLAYNEYCSFVLAGISNSDTLLLTVTNDRCFMAGQAYTLGARQLGAAIIRTGPGLPELQWDTIQRLQPTVIIAVPSFLLKLVEFAEKQGIPYKDSSIKKAICIGEPLRNSSFELNELGKRVQEKWPLELYSTYASTEMATAFTECSHGKGGHLNPELIIVECVDELGHSVEAGTEGELVVTPLGIEGMPLLRFKTGDITTLHSDICACGNPNLRIGPIVGRKKQMVKYKGTTLYPPAIKEVMMGLGLGDSFYVEVMLDELKMDNLSLYLPEELKNREIMLRDAFKARLRVVPSFQFISQNAIDRVRFSPHSRKPVDFIDKRG
jgi:phenylacetate-CoA ligase